MFCENNRKFYKLIERTAERKIQKRLGDKKAIIILGPRQVGKSTLLLQMEPKSTQEIPYLFYQCLPSCNNANCFKKEF